LLGGVILSRKIVLVLLFITLITVLAGCNFEETIEPNTWEDRGIWDKYFVYPLSFAIDYFATLLNPTEDNRFDRYGWSIVIVTILLRLLTLPLMIKQLKSSKMMQALQPEMTKIREKYKQDQQKLQQETMKLFQTHNVNPVAGCLPILVQMPILIAFYHAIMRNGQIASHSFLWLPDLGSPDPYYILPVLAGITTYYQTKMMGGLNNNPQMKILLYVMPIMILIFAISFASALSLYWVVGNIFTIIQTYAMKDKYKVNQEGAAK
jgi:YidC/Oxa1 family membrane protein insertase